MFGWIRRIFERGKRMPVEEIIGYKFKNPNYLLQALSHSSFTNEKGLPRGDSYERLEFLGDAILGYLASEYVFRRYPELPEGKLTEIKRIFVSGKTLSHIATRLGIEEYVLLGTREAKETESGHPSILADIYEAIVGAMYLDGGIEPVKRFLERFHFAEEKTLLNSKDYVNYKGKLLEFLQSKGLPPPSYKLERAFGPEHRKFYIISTWSQGKLLGLGGGFSRKEAEQQAAERALSALERKENELLFNG